MSNRLYSGLRVGDHAQVHVWDGNKCVGVLNPRHDLLGNSFGEFRWGWGHKGSPESVQLSLALCADVLAVPGCLAADFETKKTRALQAVSGVEYLLIASIQTHSWDLPADCVMAAIRFDERSRAAYARALLAEKES